MFSAKVTTSFLQGIVACLASLFLALSFSACVVSACLPDAAYAASIQVGNETEIEGWEPSDMVSTDMDMDEQQLQEAPQHIESAIVRFIKIAMPILMLACVLKIIWTAIKNIFVKKPEEKAKMGDVIKNMFIQFFFILCSFLIVELIVFAVTNGETLLVAILTGK
ncbi:MAG: hypothetical protein BZ138_06400 [Methanosphaera sp. rholeuAM270]|nr:MAG: hypothetical protein BZ138_06400 [Methanosphaera sp. rholeuAM270]